MNRLQQIDPQTPTCSEIAWNNTNKSDYLRFSLTGQNRSDVNVSRFSFEFVSSRVDMELENLTQNRYG